MTQAPARHPDASVPVPPTVAGARLRALRLVGFKSFAEKTVLEFGPGISAIVGPNGSGKSNLADALRWALGEQGRTLRTRKAEDVIFAGSARRKATGMADVTLVVDNGDALLPLDYTEIDLGRRLFRSGENEYLLNRQRVRLRDLVDLLDTANLADNAFLFIGQGMVDQALSLRPEERRPLFEEVAGVRRHERRRRHAEDQLVEAETNLARVRDILDELRPQARRLAAQAQQQEARRAAGAALAEALIASGRERWLQAHVTAARAGAVLASARTDASRALQVVRTSEAAAVEMSRRLAERAERERSRRAALDEARARVTDARLTEGRLQGEAAALERDAARLDAEAAAAETRAEAARRALSVPLEVDDGGDGAEELARLETDLAAAVAEVARVRSAAERSGERREALRRAIAAREAELDRLRARRAEQVRRHDAERTRAEGLDTVATAAAARLEEARQAVAAAAAALVERERAHEEARTSLEAAEERRRAAADAAEAATLEAGRLHSQLAALEQLLADDDPAPLLAAARRGGGRRVAEGLEVDPALRRAVEAALGAALRAVAVPEAALPGLVGARGTLVIAETLAASTAQRRGADTNAERAADALAAATEVGGGPLSHAVRNDPGGVVSALLQTAVWVPDLPRAVALRGRLPLGWRAATTAGEVVTADGVVRLGGQASLLERRADRERLAAEAGAAASAADSLRAVAATAVAEAGERRGALAATRSAVDAARLERRRAEDQERGTARAAEGAAREAAWATAQVERAATEAARAEHELATALAADGDATRPGRRGHTDAADEAEGSATNDADASGLLAWEQRVSALRARRDRAREEAERRGATRRAAEDERRRAEVRLAIDEARLAEVEPERVRIEHARERVRLDLGRATAALEEARRTEAAIRAEVEALARADEDERGQLAATERSAAEARERLRAAEERARAAEVAELEARLHADGVRESLLVELSSLDDGGRAALGGAWVDDVDRAAEAVEAADESADADRDEALRSPEPSGALTPALARALDQVISGWSATGPGTAAGEDAGSAAPTVTPARLASLRRRYQELGATNPFASAEYEEVQQRLSGMEAQRADLETAITNTRALITELNTLITERFRTTFQALEGAFAARFEQLFGGGEAQLTLTDPDDLSATGVEITARPPGKKRQALAMLSGGERALTAVALLFAMLEIRPVPFCVLDEVDAALDEANINRFAVALRSLAATTQFIVITHNRGTIEAADALYGVTLGEDAVSRVISLRLADLPPDAALGPRTKTASNGAGEGS